MFCNAVENMAKYLGVGACGEGGVVQRSLQREKDSGDSGK